ncbi:MAG: ketoacyl-ACP synthase III [Flavobacteriales bacterium]|nr:ketoacyl-ACP synthase III [Flavobacteriales bacterium]
MVERNTRTGPGAACHRLPVRVSGCAVGFPAAGRWLENDEVHALRFGRDWPSEMARQGADPAYYEAKLGVRRRYWAHTPGQPNTAGSLTALDLMEAAAVPAMERAGVAPGELDAVIAVTITSPYYTTAVSAHLAHRLGVQAPAFDMRSGCASGIFAMVVAAQLVQGGARHVLIAAGDTNSKILDPGNNTVYAGGDAGAAVVLSRAEAGAGMLAHYLDTDGSWAGHTGVPGLLPPTRAEVEQQRYTMQWRDDGKEAVLDQAWALVPETLYQRSGIQAGDIGCYVPHQAAKRQLDLAAKVAGIPTERTVNVLAEYANCGPATLFLALERALAEGRIKPGDRYMLAAAGGGLSWGGIILQH